MKKANMVYIGTNLGLYVDLKETIDKLFPTKSSKFKLVENHLQLEQIMKSNTFESYFISNTPDFKKTEETIFRLHNKKHTLVIYSINYKEQEKLLIEVKHYLPYDEIFPPQNLN